MSTDMWVVLLFYELVLIAALLYRKRGLFISLLVPIVQVYARLFRALVRSLRQAGELGDLWPRKHRTSTPGQAEEEPWRQIEIIADKKAYVDGEIDLDELERRIEWNLTSKHEPDCFIFEPSGACSCNARRRPLEQQGIWDSGSNRIFKL